MRYTLTGLLSAGVTCAFVVATPALAQAPGSPAHPKHHARVAQPAVYEAPSGGVGALGPLNALAGAPNGGGCGIATDYMGRQVALCGL
jgi:hypothetical protein